MSGMPRRDFIQTSAAGLLTMVPHLFSDGAPTQGVSTTAGQDLCFMPATALAAAIRAKRVSPVEVVNAIYARIHEINPRINAFCTLTEEQAHRAAKGAEAAVMRGDPLGALHGVPVSIKDLFLTRGVRTMFGSRIRENYVPEEDPPAVAKLLAAGTILIGKTTTPEFGFKGVTDSPLTGITRNPWDLNKTSGGSSGGAGAAVAAGLGPIAIGSDGGGSIRIPSAFNGIFGLKPSLGRVANYPSSPVPFLVHAGPMARTVHDAALMLNAIAGPDERDLLSLPADATDYLAACDGGVRRLRVAWSPTLGYAKVDPQVASVTEAAARVFDSSLGCKVEAADPGFESPCSTSYSPRRCRYRPSLWAGAPRKGFPYQRGHCSRFPSGFPSLIRGTSPVNRLLRSRAGLLARGCPWVFRSWAGASRTRPFLERRLRSSEPDRGLTNDHRRKSPRLDAERTRLGLDLA